MIGTELVNQRGQSLLAPAAEGHLGTCLDEKASSRRPDAGGRAGDGDDRVLEGPGFGWHCGSFVWGKACPPEDTRLVSTSLIM
jgi:hypothetical protein